MVGLPGVIDATMPVAASSPTKIAKTQSTRFYQILQTCEGFAKKYGMWHPYRQHLAHKTHGQSHRRH